MYIILSCFLGIPQPIALRGCEASAKRLVDKLNKRWQAISDTDNILYYFEVLDANVTDEAVIKKQFPSLRKGE